MPLSQQVRSSASCQNEVVLPWSKDTLEDPTQRVERDGFLDEIERISDATGVFDGSRFAAFAAMRVCVARSDDGSCFTAASSATTAISTAAIDVKFRDPASIGATIEV